MKLERRRRRGEQKERGEEEEEDEEDDNVREETEEEADNDTAYELIGTCRPAARGGGAMVPGHPLLELKFSKTNFLCEQNYCPVRKIIHATHTKTCLGYQKV